jgi:heme-degrading monooxygenase HmoA
MFMRVTHGHIRSGCWDDYELAYRKYVEQHAPVAGLVARWLVRSKSDPDLCITISLWQTLRDMEAYERSDAVKREILPRLAPYLSADLVAHHCEVQSADEGALFAAMLEGS